ncbi:uncharacterized protein LOC120294564 [Eucalyptus grandis]|uniref:uncharacterized protein LOC120294564 n=1 Tax=Eucalyptus grandis TaxID=71139 RepID=UPI00192EC37F|nr:uncharacterized protein LOC120294564 [Eucalyptus grandis]
MDSWIANILNQKRGLPNFEQIASLLWEIWKAQNHFLFHRHRISPDKIVESAFALANLQKCSQQQDSTGHSSWLNPNRSWHPPQQGTVKINMDGAFPIANQMGAIASIARDHSGSLIGGFTHSVSTSSALETEIQALVFTLKDLLQQNLTASHLVVESNSLILVETLNRCCLPPWECRALFAECIVLLQSFCNLSVQHCCREANALADWAAKAHGRGCLTFEGVWRLTEKELRPGDACIACS